MGLPVVNELLCSPSEASSIAYLKNTKAIHTKILFSNIPVSKSNSQKHLELHLNSKLSFEIHIKTILTIVNKLKASYNNFNEYCLDHLYLPFTKLS